MAGSPPRSRSQAVALAAVLGCGVAVAGGGHAATAATAATCAAVAPAAPGVPTPGAPCLVEVDPYPFGDDGEAVVDPSSPRCSAAALPCQLEPTSFAFRAWNRGLAAVRRPGGGTTAFGVWQWNGRSWTPDPTFPGSGTCQGDTILWAGKLDYWLVGAGNLAWPRICRFDGTSFQWVAMSVPSTTLARVTAPASTGALVRQPGGITTGSCAAWNDCWFFGTHGVVLRWDGATLSDASPDPSQRWLWGGTAGAAMRRDPLGRPIAYAVGLTTVRPGSGSGSEDLVPSRPDGAAPPQLSSSDGGPFVPSRYAPPSLGSPGDLYLTDLTDVDVDEAGRAWVAGAPRSVDPLLVRPAAVIPLTPAGPDPSCPGPAAERFPGSGSGDVYRWGAIAAVPGTRGEALVGGAYRPAGSAPGAEGAMLARVDCSGGVTESRFLVPVPGDPAAGLVPHQGPPVPAIAATAVNDAWVVLPRGNLRRPGDPVPVPTPPRIYRLTDGLPPQAVAGDDVEERPVLLSEDPILFVPPGTPSPTVLARPKLPKFSRFRTSFSAKRRTLTLNFTVRRRGMLGIEALRGDVVVAKTGLVRFGPPRGVLRLRFDPKAWPTRIRLVTDAPTAALKPLARVLTGSIRLSATASAIKGRTVARVRFDFAPAKSNDWREIATSFGAPPYRTALYSPDLPDGRYDFRAVVTDSKGEEAISPVLRRPVRNGTS